MGYAYNRVVILRFCIFFVLTFILLLLFLRSHSLLVSCQKKVKRANSAFSFLIFGYFLSWNEEKNREGKGEKIFAEEQKEAKA